MPSYNWTSLMSPSSAKINSFQADFFCCGGMTGYKEWDQFRPNGAPIGSFPFSCCPLRIDQSLRIKFCAANDVEQRVSFDMN